MPNHTELTPRQKRQQEMMAEQMATTQYSGQEPDYLGEVHSSMEAENVQQSIMNTAMAEAQREAEEVADPPVEETPEESKQEDVRIAEEKDPFKKHSTIEDDPSYQAPSKVSPEVQAQIKEQNKRIEVENYTELEKLYYDNLSDKDFEAKDNLKKQLQDLEADDNSYEVITVASASLMGPQNMTRRVMTQEAAEKKAQLRKEYNELVRPANEKYLEVIQSRRQLLKDRIDQIAEQGELLQGDVLGIGDPIKQLEIADAYLDKAERRVQANLEGKGAWGGILDEATDVDFYSVGLSKVPETLNLLTTFAKTEFGVTPSAEEVAMFEALNTYNDALQQVDVNEGYSVLSNTMQTIPWMVQMAATAGVGSTVQKGATTMIHKGLTKTTGKIAKKGINANLVRNVNKAVSRGTGFTIGTVAQVAAMPSTSVDIADRWMGDVEIERDENGEFVKAYVRQDLYDKVAQESNQLVKSIVENPNNYEGGKLTPEALAQVNAYKEMVKRTEPVGLGEAIYKGTTNAALELFTERFIGSKIAKAQGALGIKDPLDLFPPGKLTDYFNALKKTFGYDGLVPEMLEEEAIIPLNALLVGDSQYSDLWDMHQQRELFLQVAATGVLMGGFGQVVNIPSRLANQQYYKDRKAMLRKFNELKQADPNSLASIIDLASSSTNITNLVRQQEQLIKEGKNKEAEILGEKIFYNQMLKAFDTHTIDDFEDALKSQLQKPGIKPKTVENIQRTLLDITQMKDVYERYGKRKNSKTIMRLQANKMLANKTRQELDGQINDITEDVQADIDAHDGRGGFKKKDIPTNKLFDIEYENSLEGEQLTEYKQYMEDLNNLGIASVGAMERIQSAKNEAVLFGKESRILFNEQTAPNFQKKVKAETQLNKKIYQSQALADAVENSDQETFEKEFSKISKSFTNVLSEKRIGELKADLLEKITQAKVLAQIKKEQQIKEAAAVIAEKDKQEGKVNVKTEQIKAEVTALRKQEQEKSNLSPEAKELNDEFKAQADDLQFAFGFDANGNPTTDPKKTLPKENIVEEPQELSFDAPRSLSTALTDEQKGKIAQNIQAMYDLLKQELGKAPTFKDLVTKYANTTSMQQADEYYNVLALGWQENGYTPVDFVQEYDKIFDPFKALAKELMIDQSIFEPETRTKTEVADQNKKQVDRSNRVLVKPAGHTVEGTPVRQTSELRTVSSELKLGFLAMDYAEVTSETGMKTKKSVGHELKESELFDFKRLLDPDKFNAGTELNVGIPDESVLAKTSITLIDENGNKQVVSYSDWIAAGLQRDPNFKQSQEYQNLVPVFVYDTDGTPVAQIHSVTWYNSDNVGYAENPPMQAKIIAEARAEVTELRNQILNNGLNTIEIQSKEGLVYHSTVADFDMTINEASPDAKLGVGMKGKLQVGTDPFENENRVIISEIEIKTGYVYDLRRIGVDEQGRETWWAFEVFNNDKSTGKNQINDNDLNTVKWALAAHLQHTGFTSYFKDRDTRNKRDANLINNIKDRHQDIIKKIFDETGYDIENRDDLRSFMDLYIDTRNFDFEGMANLLFAEDTSIPKGNYKNHTSLKGLGTDANMVQIDANGQVSPTDNTYSYAMKDYFRTTVKSFNVGTAENPVYATTIQPKIKFGYKNKTEKVGFEVKVEDTPEIKFEEDQKKELNSSIDEVTEANQLLDELGLGGETFEFDSPLSVKDTTAIEGVFKTTPGITIQQEGTIIDFLFNEISKAVGISKGSKMDKDDLLRSLKGQYNSIVRDKRSQLIATQKKVQAAINAGNTSQELVQANKKLDSALSVYSNIGSNWSEIEKKALAKVSKYTQIKDTEISDDETVSLRQKEYDKSSLEEDSKNKTSYRLRRFFAGISNRDKEGNTKKGFLGLPTYVGFSEVYDTVAQVLSSPVETESNFDAMIRKLEDAKTSSPWMSDLVEKLKNADEQMKKEFVYNFTKHSLSMKFAMYSVTPQGNYSLKIFDTNSHEITRLIKNQWNTNLIVTPLVTVVNDEYAIDKVVAKNLLDQFNRWGDEVAKVDKAEVKAWLENFGIKLTEDAFNEITEKGMFYRGNHIEYGQMFTEKEGIFRLLKEYLERIEKQEDTGLEASDKNHPFADMTGVLNTLATIQGKYSNQTMTLSFRDNGKSIFGLTPNKYVTDRVLALKQYDEKGNNKLVEDLQKLSISQGSYILDLLNKEEDFRGKFGIDHIGITSLKERGRRGSPFSSITDLNELDHDLTKIAGLQDLRQGQVNATVNSDGTIRKGGNGISMRMGRMFLPTMSDKSQMLLLNTGVFNFFKDKKKAFNTDPGGAIDFTTTLKNLLFNQLVKPELDRISNFHNKVGKTDIVGYDMAAQIFNFIPALNNIKNEKGQRIIELMKVAPDVYTAEKIEELFRDKIDNVIEDIVHTKVHKKRKLWDSQLTKNDEGKITGIKFFDNAYLNQIHGTMEEKYNFALYDFVLNSMLTNANMYTILAGDPAMYSNDKLFKSFGADNLAITELATLYGKQDLFKPYASYTEFLDDVDRLQSDGLISEDLANRMKQVSPNPTTGTDKQYLSVSETIGVNLGKRLALLIAPGNKIAGSKGKKYTHVFLKDAVHIAENAEYLIELYHGLDALTEVFDDIQTYRNTTNEGTRADIRKKLSKRFPDLKAYFDIESTDAQEYTTVEEHLNILENQGRIPDAKMAEIRQALAEGKDLTKSQLEFVFQPIKPVYTGQQIDTNQDVARVVYIKTSSFPLLPQLTRGRQLDALRLKMEELEKKKGMPVRASYHSGNKVGSMKNPIDILNEKDLDRLEEASLELDRDNFRIQQDVPFKSDKTKEDKVSMGTQIFKLLFGDGMLDDTGFMIGEKEYTGRELYDHFNETFGRLIEIKKKALYREIGLDDNGLPIDEKKTIEKLQKLLQEEAITRGYPRQDVEGLTFVEKKDVNNETYYDFELPLWLSSNSNRYEALLNAIVTNRLIKQKMPGSSFVLGSEEGMQLTEDRTGVDNSRVIMVGDYKGKELKGVQDENGGFTYAEVLVPSKFKNSKGELIDLFEKRGGKYLYLDQTKDGFRLKPDMVEEELLSNFSFRTPTSSHVSGSIIKIAGILPPESGDLMVVPKNFTQQKGLDFDVDKETAYQLWSVRNSKTGKIETFSEKHKEELVNLKKNKQFTTDSLEDKMIMAMFGEEYQKIIDDSELDQAKKLEAFEDKLEQKLLENEFIRVHKAVFSNPNRDVQRRINKVLSMSFASDQADFIDGLNNEGIDKSDFTILDDSYQKGKMELGAAGKLAIGVYSNYVTFHSLVQQVDPNNPIQLMEEDEDGRFVPKNIRIGNLISNGKLGRMDALGKKPRSIAEVFAEKQNTATDNEKEQILGRVNVNKFTINVDSLLTLLGFDKGEVVDGQETSIPYLFLSQPIIKDYVKMMQENQGITSDFNANIENEIIEKLKEKYGYDTSDMDMEDLLGQRDKIHAQMTSENLIDEIKNPSIPNFQMELFFLFKELDDYARELSGIQGVVNTTSLGKSIIESNQKFDKLSSFPNSKMYSNVGSLIGDFIPTKGNAVRPEGYMTVGKHYVKPMTPQGQIVVNGIVTGNELWNQYFPYADYNVQAVMKEIMEIVNAEEKSDSKKLELQFQIFREIKKYLNSNPWNGMFELPAGRERETLFIDSENNTSLAKYLHTLKNTPSKGMENRLKKGVFGIKNNRLFNKFQFELQKNGEPSLIKFNNSANENFDEDYLYNSIAEMVINNEALPDKNGKPYTTRQLAADLVAYAYLEGGVQEAIQFVKYVPVEYLSAIGFSNKMQMYSPKRNSNIFKTSLGIKPKTDETQHVVSKFTKQFMQHNPQMAPSYSPTQTARFFKNIKREDKKAVSFDLDAPGEYPNFISVRNRTQSKRKQDKFSLFQHVGGGKYQRISVLGYHGMNEYELGNDNMHSLLDKADPVVIQDKKVSKSSGVTEKQTDAFDMASGNATTILTNIGNFRGVGRNQSFPKLAELLLPTVKNKLKIVVTDTSKGGTKTKADGRVNIDPKTGQIVIEMDVDLMKTNDHNKIAQVFMHEFIHSVTATELGQYFDMKTGEKIVDTLPPHVARLQRVFEATKKQLGPELDALIEKRRKQNEGLLPGDLAYSEVELQETYAGTSIFEFVAVAMTEPAFQRRMNEVNFRNSGQSILHRFKTAVMNILFKNGMPSNEKSITFEALSSTIDFIEIEAKKRTSENNVLKYPDFFDKEAMKQFEQTQAEAKGSVVDQNFTDKINSMDMPYSAMPAINNLFETNSELQQIGSPQEYSKFLSLTENEVVLDVEGFKNYKKGMTPEVLDSLPDICE